MYNALIDHTFNFQGHEDEARKILRDLQNDEKVIEQRVRDYIELNKDHLNTNFWSSVKRKEILCNLAIVLGLFLIQAFTGEKPDPPRYN